MCYRSREVKNGFTGHWGQKQEWWTRFVKMVIKYFVELIWSCSLYIVTLTYS
jgi:hypothetical protein